MEIKPASLAQVQRTDRGKLVAIDDDVANVAKDLQAIDPSLKLFYVEEEDYFTVQQHRVNGDGSVSEHLVTTWDVEENGPLDQRLVQRVREISAPGYNLGLELEKADAAADRERDWQMSQKIGPAAERLAHAIRKDLNLNQGRAYMPRGVGDGA